MIKKKEKYECLNIHEVKIGGLVYKIKYVDKDVTDYDFGQFENDKMEIWINKDVPLEMQKTTLLHEIIEIINFMYEIKFHHRTMTTLESVLFQILKENKELVKKIFSIE